MIAMSGLSGINGRRSNRLRGWDYRTPGAYFVTIATFNRERLFEDRSLRRIVERTWVSVVDENASIESGDFVVMPDHVHGIIWIRTAVGASHSERRLFPNHRCTPECLIADQDIFPSGSPLRTAGAPSGSLGAIVGSFKAVASKRLNRWRRTPGKATWQRNYYERVIRSDDELERIRLYILANPLRVNHGRGAPENIDEGVFANGRLQPGA
jgi:REP element-mobilizing transposase RayT